MSAFHQPDYVEGVNDCVIGRTVDGIINFWNRSAEKLYGWRKEEVVGKVSHNLLQTQFPKPLQEIESELVQNGRWEGKLVHTTRQGDHVVVQSQWTLDLNGHFEAVVETNTPFTEGEMDSRPGIDLDSVETGRQEVVPASKLMKTENRIPEIANIVLTAGACLSLLVVFYAIYYYEGTADERFSTATGIILYWILPAVLATLLFAFLRRGREAKVRTALLFVSITVSLYAVEFTLSILTPAFRSSVTFWGGTAFLYKEEISALAKQAGVNFDLRTKLEVVRDLRKRGISAVPAIVPSLLLTRQRDDSFRSKIAFDGVEILPLGGISDRVTVLCNETGSYTIYESDERGFHNPKGIWGAPQVAIAALGDSFTIGSCVPSDKNFVSLIREQYLHTLNLGMLGKGPLTMLATLREYLPSLKPRVVLWFYFEDNDFRDLLKESKTPLLRNYLEDDFKQGLFHRQADIDQALAGYIEESIKTRVGKIEEEGAPEDQEDTSSVLGTVESFLKLRHLRGTFRNLKSAVQRREREEYSYSQLNLFRNILLEAKESVGSWKGTLYFVYLPARDRYANRVDHRRQSVLEIVRDIGVPIIDVHARFELQDDPLSLFPFGRFGHYNEEGHRLVAEEVLRAIAFRGRTAHSSAST